MSAVLSELTARARSLIEKLDPAAALAAVAGQDGAEATVLLVRAGALAALDQFREAYDLVCGLLERRELGPAERLEALVHKARLLRKASRKVDLALETAFEAASAGTQQGGSALALAGEAHIEAALLLSRKRCRKLAARSLAAAAAALPDDPRALVFEGLVMVDFDERLEARAKFEAARERGGAGGERWGRLALAHVDTLLGDFDAARAHLAALTPLAPGDLWGRWLAVRLALAQHDWLRAAEALGDLVSASPRADAVHHYEYERAGALYRAGRRDEARAAFAGLAAAAGEDEESARAARRMTRLLAREGAASRPSRRLQAFPSVMQLRNHCGPASCELYLRFYGRRADQVDIAREIKFADGGTPVYRARSYLDSAGLHTRRIEATLPRIKALVDAGVPVLMEEDYSDTRHVAIAIGYDDALEILEVQDPMTHEVRETFYEDLPRIRDLSNDGALVGVPADDAPRLAALDAAGASECRYIALVDQAWAAYHSGRPDQADALVAESLALRRDYELAWFYRFRRARERANADRSIENNAALHRILGEVSALWPDDEWPQQFLGEVLSFEGKPAQALAAFARARDRDDPDPQNWSMMGECLLALGRYAEAQGALESALERNPAHVRANENLAWLANLCVDTARGLVLNECARELNPDNPFNYTVQAALCERRGDFAAALSAYEQALARDPNRRDAAIARARVLARLGRIDDAAAALGERIARAPEDAALRVELADLLYAHDRTGAAIEVCRALLLCDDKNAAAHAIVGAALCKQGELDAGLCELERAIALRPMDGAAYAHKGRALRGAGRTTEAVQAFAAAVGLTGGEPQYEYELGETLVLAEHALDGVGHLRGAARRMPMDQAQLERVGLLVAETESAQAAQDWFTELEAGRPDDGAVLSAHAHVMTEELWLPALAAPALRRLAALAPDDPLALAFRGAETFDASEAGESAGEALVRQAIAAAPDLAYPRRALSERLRARGRFEAALEALAPCPSSAATVHERVVALLGLGRVGEAEAEIVAFEQARAAKQPVLAALKMRYQVARRRWDWEAALALADRLAHESGERAGDGQLDDWEVEKFECLARLGWDERARRLAEFEATSGAALGRLAGLALGADRLALAEELAEWALRLLPDQVEALRVEARLAELAGAVGVAQARWRRIGEIAPSEHGWHENLARIALGMDDLAGATGEAAAALGGGHTCPHAYAVRAQVRLLEGDRAGARADLERSWALTRPELREHDDAGDWAIRALLSGDRAEAARLVERYLREGAPISALDRARLARVLESLR